MVVEFCQFGSLEEYLRQHRGTFFDEFHARGIANNCGARKAAVSYVRLECLVKTSDLIIWAYQIANAMEYLSSRKIVHGDVALRNMLLDSNQSVKITDFGLSKHIYTQTSLYESKKKVKKLKMNKIILYNSLFFTYEYIFLIHRIHPFHGVGLHRKL